MAVISESETTLKETAGAAPKPTALVPSKPPPITVTTVPPAVGPASGLMLVTSGAVA